MKNAILVLTILAVPCFGATINVNWDGTGDHTTIQAGINAAVSGDTVIVASGTYIERIGLQSKSSVSIVGAGADITTINGGAGGHVVVFNLSSGSIEGFTITNSGNNPGYSAGLFTSQCNVTVKDCVIEGNHHGVTFTSGSYGSLINCIVAGQSAWSAVEFNRSNGIVCNSVIANNSWHAIYCSDASPSITNNTIVFNNSYGILCNPTSTQFISNNIIMLNKYGIFALGGGSSAVPLLNISYNDVYANSVADYWQEWGTICIPEDPFCQPEGESEPFLPQPGTGEINVDPLFATGPLGDYYLGQISAGQGVDSPCINAGSDTAENLGMDIYTTRTDKVWDVGIVDMGYHYSGNVADFDNDDSVDLEEFGILFSQWQDVPGVPSADIAPEGGDNFVDLLDLLMLTENWLWQQ